MLGLEYRLKSGRQEDYFKSYMANWIPGDVIVRTTLKKLRFLHYRSSQLLLLRETAVQETNTISGAKEFGSSHLIWYLVSESENPIIRQTDYYTGL